MPDPFVLDGTGDLKEADGERTWQLWCVNAIVTQQRAWAIYSAAFGSDLEAIQQAPDESVQEHVLVREITAALMANRQVAAVSNFVFSRDGEIISVSVDVTSQRGTNVTIPVVIA